MPELTVHSIPAPHPLPPSLYAAAPADTGEPPTLPAVKLPAEPDIEKDVQVAAVPPVINPAAWEDFAVFRETFLMYLTPPDYAAALRKVGEMLFTMILESYDPWPGWPESSTRTELRAAHADLCHLEGFLGAVGREHAVSSLGREDDRLSRFAARQAAEVAKIAHRIDAELAKSVPPRAEEA
ncbi:MAG TPA: hypothetical protein VLX28_16245 [Thermoanaerobaculia bacterium]|nr:hypothetical protein [Thermoanaerobaculia bacterium]